MVLFGVYLGQEYSLPSIKNVAIVMYEVFKKNPYTSAGASVFSAKYGEFFSSIKSSNEKSNE
jgi:hypothetical protein